jgi:hypothetical protein
MKKIIYTTALLLLPFSNCFAQFSIGDVINAGTSITKDASNKKEAEKLKKQEEAKLKDLQTTLNNNPILVDTAEILGNMIVRKRIDLLALKTALINEDASLYGNIRDIENQLDEYYESIESAKSVLEKQMYQKDYLFVDPSYLKNKLKEYKRGAFTKFVFDYTPYQEELDFYVKCNKQYTELKANAQAAKDSIKFAQEKVLANVNDSLAKQRIMFEAEANANALVNAQLRAIEEEKLLNEKRKALTKKYGKRNADLMLNEQVEIGFTKEMVAEAWGDPASFTKSVVASSVLDYWYYNNGDRVTFKNGKVISYHR